MSPLPLICNSDHPPCSGLMENYAMQLIQQTSVLCILNITVKKSRVYLTLSRKGYILHLELYKLVKYFLGVRYFNQIISSTLQILQFCL